MNHYEHNTAIFIAHDSQQLFFQSWEVENPQKIVIVVHGLGEHSGRYYNLLKALANEKISFYAYDHRGHGNSGGSRGHLEHFEEYLLDLNIFINLIKQRNESLPILLFGHSMGGVIALKYVLDYPNQVDKIILSSPGLIPAIKIPVWKEKLGQKLSKILPKLTIPSGLKAEDLSHDQEVVQKYLADPLVHNKVSARWFTEFTKAGQESLQRSSELKIPLFLFHGKNDKIVAYQGSQQVFEKASSEDKEIYLAENLYHETMNEALPEKEEVLAKVKAAILKEIKN